MVDTGIDKATLLALVAMACGTVCFCAMVAGLTFHSTVSRLCELIEEMFEACDEADD